MQISRGLRLAYLFGTSLVFERNVYKIRNALQTLLHGGHKPPTELNRRKVSSEKRAFLFSATRDHNKLAVDAGFRRTEFMI